MTDSKDRCVSPNREYKICGIILARGGSKGIPRKNLHPIAGKPMLCYSIRAAVDSGVFGDREKNDVWVSTDDEEIAAVAREYGANVYIRSAENARDTSSSEAAISEFLQSPVGLPYEVVFHIQATSPLTLPEHYRGAWELMREKRADSLVTVTRSHRFRWKAVDGDISTDSKGCIAQADNYNPIHRPRRQDWDGELMENGCFYAFVRSVFEDVKCRLGNRVAAYVMPRWTEVEVDDWFDLSMIEAIADKTAYKPDE